MPCTVEELINRAACNIANFRTEGKEYGAMSVIYMNGEQLQGSIRTPIPMWLNWTCDARLALEALGIPLETLADMAPDEYVQPKNLLTEEERKAFAKELFADARL